jgi:hypothetical protein
LKKYPLSSRVPPSSTIHIAFRYLHYDGGISGLNSDFVGLDYVHITRTVALSVPMATQPIEFELWQNHPNPFNPWTEIRFAAPHGPATVEVFNMVGEKVAEPFRGTVESIGFTTIRFDARDLGSGVYFYRLKVGGVSKVRRMLLLK